MNDQTENRDAFESSNPPVTSRPPIVGDVVFGNAASPVAVCTLASRTLLGELAGRQEIAIAGRVFTENVGVERMVQNLAAMASIRVLIVCGRETQHRVGQTILALHRNGVTAEGRVIGSDAPEPVLPNLVPADLDAFRERVRVVDMIGELDVPTILARADVEQRAPASPALSAAHPTGIAAPVAVERVQATRDPASAWVYDPTGYFLVFVDRPGQRLRVEQYTPEHVLVRVIDGAGADELCHTIVRLEHVSLLAHAAYLGRELARAETALRLGLDYEQDRPLTSRRALDGEGERA